MANRELIEKLESLEAGLIPPCFKVDMEAVKGQMLQLIYKMCSNTIIMLMKARISEMYAQSSQRNCQKALI